MLSWMQFPPLGLQWQPQQQQKQQEQPQHACCIFRPGLVVAAAVVNTGYVDGDPAPPCAPFRCGIDARLKLFSLPRSCFVFGFVLFLGFLVFGFGCFYVLIMRLIRFLRSWQWPKSGQWTGLQDPHLHLHFKPMAMAVKVSDRGRLLRF